MTTAELSRTSSLVPTGREADLYAAIATSWYWSNPRGGHIQRPMRQFVLGPDFAAVAARWPDSVYGAIVAACARIVSLHNWELLGVQIAKHAQGTGTLPKEGLDPVMSEWYPLDGTSGLGVHFWRLGSGVIELRSVGPFNHAPALQFARFAATERKLSEEVRRTVDGRTRGPR
jgi:hypothetical protein